MQWIALVVGIWGAGLAVSAGGTPALLAAASGVGLALVLVVRVVAARRRSRGAAPARVPVAEAGFGTISGPTGDALDALDPADRRLLDLYWNFPRISDVALLAECDPGETQRRLITLLLSPTGVPAPEPERPATAIDRARVVLAFRQGASLQALAAEHGLSEWTCGRIVLEHAPRPVGLAVPPA